MRTLQECKNEVAKSRNCKDWKDFLVKVCYKVDQLSASELVADEVAELYASQYKEELSRLQIDRDEKEVMIDAFDKAQKLFRQREWLTQGRGCYPYNDDRYKEEVRYLMDEFEKVKDRTWKSIKTKTADYKAALTKDAFDYKNQMLELKIAGLEEELSRLKGVQLVNHVGDGRIIFKGEVYSKIEPSQSGNSESVKLTEEKPETPLFNFEIAYNDQKRMNGLLQQENQRLKEIAKVVAETGAEFYDNPNGPYEYSCPFCCSKTKRGGNEPQATIADIKHDVDCAYILAVSTLNPHR
jgi:hypothetical protein